jgi:hypothetical protein
MEKCSCKKVISGKTFSDFCWRLESQGRNTGSGAEFGYIGQRHRLPDPDLDKNVMDPQH